MSNESRKARALRQQNPGMASAGRVDPATGARARRAAAGEQAAGVRYRQGLRVQDDGSLEVHTDGTLRVDQRQQLGLRNKFDTPTKGTEAANKDYVDAQVAGVSLLGDSEYVVGNASTGTAATTAWVPIDQSFLYQHNNTVSPSVSSAVYAQVTHTGTGDECVYLYPGYVYALALSVRCYTQSFYINVSYAGTDSATTWSSDSRSERFASSNVDLTVYAILDNTAGAYTYIVPRFRRYNTGTANLSTSRMHIRRLQLHYEGGYEAAASPGLPDAPVADFEADSTSVARRAYILFGNTTTGTVTSYAWTFGDGTTSTDESPSKAYASAGTYTVALTATGPGGNDTETKTSYITVT